MQTFFLFKGERGKTRRMMRIQGIEDHPYRDIITNRMKAIWLLERSRLEEIKMVFGFSKTSVYEWRRRLKASGGDVRSLAPYRVEHPTNAESARCVRN